MMNENPRMIQDLFLKIQMRNQTTSLKIKHIMK